MPRKFREIGIPFDVIEEEDVLCFFLAHRLRDCYCLETYRRLSSFGGHMSTQSAPEVFDVLKHYGIRQKDLAFKFDVSEAVVSMWVRGKKPVPAYRRWDLWALASLAREAVASGRQGRDVLPDWEPSWLVWRNAEKEELFTREWAYPSAALTELPEGQDIPELLFTLPQAEDYLNLREAVAVIKKYAKRVLEPAEVGVTPTATDLEILRYAFNIATSATLQIQEGLAREPLPITTPK